MRAFGAPGTGGCRNDRWIASEYNKRRWRPTATQPPQQSDRGNNGRKRNFQEENRQECQRGDAHHESVLQHLAPDSPQRLDDDLQHGGLEPEQHACGDGQLAPQHIGDAQCENAEEAGKDEQDPGDQPTAYPVQDPADVDRQLLCFRAGQKHGEVQRVKKALFRDPAPFLDQQPVHDRDLAGWPAKAVHGHQSSDAHRIPEQHGVLIGRHGHHRLRTARTAESERSP